MYVLYLIWEVYPCACWLLRSFFLRFVELHGIKAGDLIVNDCYMQLFLKFSKPDKYRDDSWILIAANDQNTCLWIWLKLYLKLANV